MTDTASTTATAPVPNGGSGGSGSGIDGMVMLQQRLSPTAGVEMVGTDTVNGNGRTGVGTVGT